MKHRKRFSNFILNTVKYGPSVIDENSLTLSGRLAMRFLFKKGLAYRYKIFGKVLFSFSPSPAFKGFEFYD